MNVVRRITKSRRIGLIGSFGVVMIGLLCAATTAQADDWQLCISNQPDQVPIACTAVINQGGRGDAEIARAYAIRGEWFRARKRNDEALADFNHAEKLDPNSYVAIAGHGATLAQMGQLQEAAAQYERAIALNPQLPAAYLLRGELRQRQNQLADAMADFDHAIDLRADVAIAYVRRGALLNINGALDRAMADVDRAIALNPNLADAFFVRGGIYRKRGDLDHAIVELTRAIALAPTGANSYWVRGDLYSAKGDIDRAIADYDKALSITPDNRAIQQQRQFALAAKTALGNAVPSTPQPAAVSPTVSPTAPAVSPANPPQAQRPVQPALALAGSLLQLRKFDDAAAVLTQVIATNPNLATAYSLRGAARLGKLQTSDALADFNQSIALEPGNAHFLIGRATAYLMTKQYRLRARRYQSGA